MGFVRTLILSLYAMLTLCWKFLPVVGALVGYALFAPPAWLGAIMAAILGIAGYLAKSTAASLFYKTNTHGSARFAGLADARKGKLLTGKGLILGRKHGRMLRYRGEGHLLTFAPSVRRRSHREAGESSWRWMRAHRAASRRPDW